MKKLFKVFGSGNYSFAYNWDDGMNVNGCEEISIDEIKASNRERKPYDYINYISLDRFKEDSDEHVKVQTYCFNSHGGSRYIEVIVSAETSDEAKDLAQKSFDKSWKRYQ